MTRFAAWGAVVALGCGAPAATVTADAGSAAPGEPQAAADAAPAVDQAVQAADRAADLAPADRLADAPPRPAPANDASAPAPSPAGSPLAGIGTLEHVAGGYQKLDTPAWRPRDGFLVFTDLTRNQHYKLVPPGTVEVYRDGAFRCTSATDGALYCLGPTGLSRTPAGSVAPEPLATAFPDGSPLSLNDAAVSGRGLMYFSNLKAPEPPGVGSLAMLDVARRTVTVLWDARMVPGLSNPNGVALSPDERFLYVGISAYDQRSRSGVYRFPIRDDGTVDVAVGQAAKWLPVTAPDGIAVDVAGNLYVTAGAAVQVYGPDGKRWGRDRDPEGQRHQPDLRRRRHEVALRHDQHRPVPRPGRGRGHAAVRA